MNTQTEQKDIWIALANLSIDRINSSISDANYAYVTVVGRAKDKIDFEKKVANELSRQGFKLLGLEEVDKFESRIKEFKVEDAVTALAKDLNSNEEVKFSIFHTYD
jgi:hypothetical protein